MAIFSVSFCLHILFLWLHLQVLWRLFHQGGGSQVEVWGHLQVSFLFLFFLGLVLSRVVAPGMWVCEFCALSFLLTVDRYMNHPNGVYGYAGFYGMALISHSWNIFFLAIFSHVCHLLFIYYVERFV
jgi:hypothetical protein